MIENLYFVFMLVQLFNNKSRRTYEVSPITKKQITLKMTRILDYIRFLRILFLDSVSKAEHNNVLKPTSLVYENLRGGFNFSP